MSATWALARAIADGSVPPARHHPARHRERAWLSNCRAVSPGGVEPILIVGRGADPVARCSRSRRGRPPPWRSPRASRARRRSRASSMRCCARSRAAGRRLCRGRSPRSRHAAIGSLERWLKTYGRETTTPSRPAHRREPPLDISVKADPVGLGAAARWRAARRPVSIRLNGHASDPDTARLCRGPIGGCRTRRRRCRPASSLAVKPGDRVADLCAAPGGKPRNSRPPELTFSRSIARRSG